MTMSRQIRYTRWRRQIDQRADGQRRFRTANGQRVHDPVRNRAMSVRPSRATEHNHADMPDAIRTMHMVWDHADDLTDGL